MPKLDISVTNQLALAQAKKTPNYRGVFEQFGVIFPAVNGTEEARAEACPWCGKDRFYVNVTTGLYHCKHCDEGHGNVQQFLTWVHGEYLDRTTTDHYRDLKECRGIAIQSLERHGLAYDATGGRWLIPFRNPGGSVVNVQFYHPHAPKGHTKYNLPLPTSLYGLDRLSPDKKKILFLCEGPFDAIALDYHLKLKRGNYDIVAAPGTFKEGWTQFFRGRKVRALFDNDKGGQAHRDRVRKLLGEGRVAEELLLLQWPDGTPDGYDINDLVRDKPELKIVGWISDHSVKVTAEPKLVVHHGRRAASEDRPVEWLWPDHLRCGTYASFSGRGGTYKTTIALDLAARYTRGERMPECDKDGLPPGHVLYVYVEDDRTSIEERFESFGGDFDRWHAMPAQTRDGDPLNVLDHLEEMRGVVRQYGIRFVVIDGQNSMVGAPNISTDMLARNNVTNKLHRFAQQENVCLLGIRNEDAEGRAYGPASMADIGRCVLRAVEEDPPTNPRHCKLVFVKVSDTAPQNYPPIPYSVEDCGGARRRIVWGKSLADTVRSGLGGSPQADTLEER